MNDDKLVSWMLDQIKKIREDKKNNGHSTDYYQGKVDFLEDLIRAYING